MPEVEPLTPEQVDQQEEGDLDVPYVSKQQWIATIRDRERQRGDWVKAGNVLSENCNEYSIEVFNLKQERDDLRHQLEEARKAIRTWAGAFGSLETQAAELRLIAEGKDA